LGRLEPEFVPAALAFESRIHGAAAFFFAAWPLNLAYIPAFVEVY
jgi:hypothetical protein